MIHRVKAVRKNIERIAVFIGEAMLGYIFGII